MKSSTHGVFRDLTATEEELVMILKHGEVLKKLSKRGGPPKFRKFWISEDMEYLLWETEHKPLLEKPRVRLDTVIEVLSGQQTLAFRNTKDISQLEAFSFSLVTERATLDLICSDLMQTQTWVKGLSVLVERACCINPQSNTYPGRRGTLRTALNSIGDKLRGPRQSIIHSKPPLPTTSTPPPPSTTTINQIQKNDPKRHSSPHRTTMSMSSFNLDAPAPTTASPFGISLKKTGDLESLVRKDSRDLPPVPLKRAEQNTKLASPAPILPEKPLFEFVVVVKLESVNGGPVDPNKPLPKVQYDSEGLPISHLNPNITYSFPPSNCQKKENRNLMGSIPLFCFPDIDLVVPLTTLESKTYSFVLTDLDGSRRFGYCKRMLPAGSGKRWPETYCIISSHPCFEIFNTILNAVESRNKVNSVSVFSFLKTVLARPFPERGTVVNVQVQNLATGKFDELRLERPMSTDPVLEHIDFKPLFTHMQKIENVISIFASVLMERRIIFFSNDISVLSSVTHAFVSLIYPFTWQHVFIPVLPKSLLDYVCSPVPFVVGVLSIYRKIIDTMPMEEVVYVDLDHDKIIGEDDRKTFPESDKKYMEKNLKTIIQKGKPIIKEQVAEAFLEFFLKNFGDYRKFMKNKEFDSAGFIKSRAKASKKFYDVFQNSQMYERWTFDRQEVHQQEKDNGTSTDAFEAKSLHYQ